MSDSPELPSEPTPAPGHPPAHRVALRLLVAVPVAGTVAMLGSAGAVLLTGDSTGLHPGQAALIALALGVVCAAMEVGAEAVRRLGPWRALALLVPGAIATVLAAAATIVWFAALAEGRDPLGAAEEVAVQLGKLVVSNKRPRLSGAHPLFDSELVRALVVLGPPLAVVAFLRGRRARARLLLPSTAAAALLPPAASFALGWSTRASDAAGMTWPVWAALGLLLVDRVEPRAAAGIRRAWLAARGEPPDAQA